MKKFILMLLFSLLLYGCNGVISYDNIILPLFSTNSKAQNKIWIGTFQLVFNDMKNNIIKHDILFVNEPITEELKGLNAQEFNSSMLNESSYYKSYGLTSFKARDNIKTGIKQKFNETSDIIDTFDWSPGSGKYYAYAMIKKEFEFLNEFDKLNTSKFNNSSKVYKYFGIKKDSSKLLYKNVDILFYNNENDYAVSLLTKTKDRIYLYRTDSNDNLKKSYAKMLDNKAKYEGDKIFNKNDTLKVPNLKFKKIREYPELCNRKIKGTDYYFSKAIETVQFELDNKGGKVKSEAIITMKNSIALKVQELKPRHFNFDKPFNMYLIDSGKNNPYMALRIYNLDDFIE